MVYAVISHYNGNPEEQETESGGRTRMTCEWNYLVDNPDHH